MALLDSPALKQVETALKVSPGSFNKNNYRSVFDIARTSRKQFIADNMSWLGLRGGKAWDLAVGQAQHIRRLFREKTLTRQIREEVQRQTLSGQPVRRVSGSDNIQGLVQNGPTWQNQFAENWQAYCQPGAPEAVDSPVSYLTWLYKQALTFEQEIQASSSADQVIPLAERRPDLAALTVDNNTINQQVPALQLVNEILENSIAPSLPSEQSVDETLAQTRYPTLLPYHFPHDQVALSLENADVLLEEIIGETATDWPWFLKDSWQGTRSNTSIEFASGLAPEQQTLVTEPDHSTGSDLTTFYKTNLGLETADYTPFDNLDTFTHQLGLTVPQVEALVAGNAGGSSVVSSENVDATIYIPSPDYYGAAFINNERTSMINGSFVMPQGGEKVSGHFDNGIMLNSKYGQGAYLNYDVFSDMTKDATLGFWYKVPSDIPVGAIVVGNIEGASLNSKGVSLSIGTYNQRVLQLFASDGKKTINNNSYLTYINLGEWNYVALVYSAADKKLTLYQSTYDSEFDVSDFETLSSGANTFWFNGNANNAYYQAHPDYEGQVSYDDITVWERCLSLDEITTIVNAAVSVSQIAALSDYTDNISFAPAISMVAPESSEMMLSNSTYVNGKFGQGIQTRSTDDSYFYFQPDGKVAQAMKGDKSFTLGFWVNRLHYDARRVPVVTNGGDADAPSYSSGHSLSCYQSDESSGYHAYDIIMYLVDENGNEKGSGWITNGIENNSWYFVALTWDASSKQAIWYKCNNDIPSSFEINGSELGDITTAPGFTWAFNVRGDLTHGRVSTEDVPNFIYDDITVFNGALTAEEINIIATSGKPVAETDLSGFSADCIWTSSLDHGLQNLSDARMDRINRMVRLQRWLGLSYEETDLLLSACIRAQGTDNADFSLNAHTLRALGVFRHWQQKYGVNAFEFAAVLNEITPYAISPAVPFFDQVFNSPSLFDEPLAITGDEVSYTEVTGESARTVRQICAGLNITQAQFRVLADKVAAEQGNPGAKTFPLTLPVVSAFYRLVIVPRWLGLSFAEGAALLSLAGEGDTAWTMLAGVPQLAALSGGQPAGGDILDLLMALDAAAAWAADHQLSWVKNYLALQPETDALVATPATVNFVNGIKQQLPATLLSEQSFAAVPLPAGSAVSGWLAVFPDLIDGNGLVQEVATDDSTIAAMVEADITSAGITFASDADREQAVSALSGIISQARLAQNGIADSALAQMFSTGQSLPPYLLNWAGDSEYRLLSDSLTLNSGAALTDPSQVPATYLTDLFALGQRAGISSAFTLTPAALSVFLAHPDWFGVSDTTLSLTLLYRFSRYGDWLKVAEDEDRVLAYLSWVNGATPPDGGQAANALALLLGWESSEVADATAALPGGLAKTVPDVDYVLRLQQLSTQTGLSVTPLLTTGELAPGSVTETWDAWQSAGESLVAAQSAQQ